MRLFFALWPPRETAAELHAWARDAQRSTGGRVTRADTIHLTLAFLGEVDEASVPGLKGLSVKAERHSLPMEQARYWPHNRIVWAGPLETPGPLGALAVALASELKAKGFRTESRSFKSHVTLIRKAREPGELLPLPPVNWPVEEFVLVRSRLSAAGPRYEVIERVALSRTRPRDAGSDTAPGS